MSDTPKRVILLDSLVVGQSRKSTVWVAAVMAAALADHAKSDSLVVIADNNFDSLASKLNVFNDPEIMPKQWVEPPNHTETWKSKRKKGRSR